MYTISATVWIQNYNMEVKGYLAENNSFLSLSPVGEGAGVLYSRWLETMSMCIVM